MGDDRKLSWAEFQPGRPVRFIGDQPVFDKAIFDHFAFHSKAVMPCRADWHDCAPCTLFARHRGLAIHTIRVAIQYRHMSRDIGRQLRALARQHIKTLRTLGAGPVLLPTNHAGPATEWWGPPR